MRKGLLSILFLFCFIDSNYAQTDGVVSFDVPAKNSLKFNKFLINPAFSYVKEDESFIALYNKTQWTGFENAPKAYFFSYSSKFREDNGIAFGLFQRNYGILTSFGAVANFARNVELSNDSNFTFGLNLAYLNSGINSGSIVTNDPSDASLQNAPKNSLITINPGINYSAGFMDFGISANNLFTYNFSDSGLLSDDPAKSIAGTIMYTGYMYNSGFLENAKFSTLIKGEMAKGNTIISGSVLFNAPKAGWIQAGYNNVYGLSGGIGFILAKKISIGYTAEKGLGNFTDFGISHEITLAYKLRGYGDYEDYKPIVKATKKTNPGATTKKVAIKKKTPAELKKERDEQLALKAEQERARLEAERLRREKDLADARAKAEADARAKAEAEKLLALQGKESAEARAKAAEAVRLKAEQDKANAIAEAERLRQEKLAANAKAKVDAIANAKAEADRLKAEQAKNLADAERLRKEKEAADAKAKADAIADAALKAKQEADRLKAEKDKNLAEIERLRKEKEAADKAKADADAKAKLEADKLKADQAKALAEAERLRKEKEIADAKVKADAEAKAKADAETERLRLEAEAKAKLNAAKTAEDKELDNLREVIDDSKKNQTESLSKFESIVDSKEKELLELRRINDLSDKGIVTEAKEYQSTAAANRALETIKTEITENAKTQDRFLKEFETLAAERLKKVANKNDLVNQNYAKTLEKLRAEKLLSEKKNAELLAKLEKIKEETDIEKKRRIKQAKFDNNQAKYLKDRETLKQLKLNTAPNSKVYKTEDFDFGDEDQSNMQIIKNIENLDNGFYLVVAAHKDEAKRDAFIKKAIESGQTNIDFFYNVSTSTYYIYYQKFTDIQDATQAQEQKGSKPYNAKMVIVKVEK